MAVRVMSKVWEGFPGGGPDLLALLALADWSDDEGRCYPSIASIAKKVRLGDKQARRIVHRLIKSGFVDVKGNDLGGSNSRRYQINLERLTTPENGSPPKKGSPPKNDRPPLPPKGGDPSHSYGSRTVIDTSINRQRKSNQPTSDRLPECPHQEIIDLYHRILPMGRQVRIWTEARKAMLRARWREDEERQTLDWWKRLFDYIAQSDFLTGKVCVKDRKPFEIDLEWIVKPANLVKIIEGKYDEGRES